MNDERKNFDVPMSPLRSTGAALTDSVVPRDGRRALLGAGIAAAPLFVTLASRPALAASNACTISGMTSGLGSNHLAPSVGRCGSPPNCWSTRTSDWVGFSGSTQFTTTFMSGVASAMTYSGSNSFTACLSGSTSPRLNVTFESSVASSTTNILAQCVAAVLNAALFGSDNVANAHDYYNHGSVSAVKTTINNYLKAASHGKASVSGSIGSSDSRKASNALACMNSLTSVLTGWNSQSGSSC